jgi:excinuclease UvrABC ATPase subunit
MGIGHKNIKRSSLHTDKCEGCGSSEVAWFDRKGFYVLCDDCKSKAFKAGLLDDGIKEVRLINRYRKVI